MSEHAGGCAAVLKRVDTYFEITARGSTYAQELRGGLATFLTMSYILLVNPQILTQWLVVDGTHADLSDIKDEFSKSIATSTALVCGLGCIAVGVASRMPFAIGPGMGLNTFVAGLYVRSQTYAGMDAAQKAWGMVATSTFLAGALLAVMSAAGAVSPIITNLPETIKTSIMVGIGAYQAFIGFREMGVLAWSGNDDIIALESAPSFAWGDRDSPTSGYAQVAFLVALLITTTLFAKGVKGSILFGIVFCTAACWAMGVGGGGIPSPPVALPLASNYTFSTMDFNAFFTDGESLQSYLPQVFVILLITIFDCGGVQYGVAKLLDLPARYRADVADADTLGGSTQGANTRLVRHASSMSNRSMEADIARAVELDALKKQLRKLEGLGADGVEGLDAAKARVTAKMRHVKAGGTAAGVDADVESLLGGDDEQLLLPKRTAQITFVCVGVLDMVAGVMGASPCIVFLECAAGVQEGAATGLASVVTGLLFLLTMFLSPIFQSVPLAASAGPLIFIGCLMMSHVGEIDWHDLAHALPAFFTILLMPFTSSITPGIVSGLAVYFGLRALMKIYDAAAAACRSLPPLHKAAKRGTPEDVARLLADPAVDKDARDVSGSTAFHLAVRRGDHAVLQAFVDGGADASIPDADGLTVPQLAARLAARRREGDFQGVQDFGEFVFAPEPQ
eukprot:TRINITY_DN1661_c1_g4_i1.p1 TRINITY_DN1661_c1_g4~~TRINITY_DN1661_c1_g4_i1.p1  ORF type:complete len:679 (+),score=262.95 TRINITY_DN1661_c1_g4_i1:73-2109(+)